MEQLPHKAAGVPQLEVTMLRHDGKVQEVNGTLEDPKPIPKPQSRMLCGSLASAEG